MLFRTRWEYPVERETVLLWAGTCGRRADCNGSVVIIERGDCFTALALFYGIGWSKSREKMDSDQQERITAEDYWYRQTTLMFVDAIS